MRNRSSSKIHCCYIIISTELKEKHTLEQDEWFCCVITSSGFKESVAAGSELCKREKRSKSLSIWCGLCPLGIGHPDARCLVEHVVRVYGTPPLNSYPTWNCASTGPCPTPSPAHRFLLLVIPWAGIQKSSTALLPSSAPTWPQATHIPSYIYTLKLGIGHRILLVAI